MPNMHKREFNTPLTTTEYEAVLKLFHEFPQAFYQLSDDIRKCFYDRLYG